MKNNYHSSIVAANEYMNIAKEAESKGDIESARINYINAGIELTDALACCPSGNIGYLERKLEVCKIKIESLKPKPKENKRLKLGDDSESEIIKSFELPIPKITYDDVAGMDSLKKKLMRYIIEPLKDPERYKKYKRTFSHGVLLYGAPGCGKTFISDATVGEASKILSELGIKLTYLGGDIARLLNSWVGNTEKNIAALFEEAKEKQPAIILFDEITGIGMARSGHGSSYAKRFTDQLLNSFNGLREKQVLVLATTNYPWGVDPAFFRPGRFDEIIRIDPPDFNARQELFRLCLKDLYISEDINFDELANLTELYSPADIEKIIDVATDAPYDEHRQIEQSDIIKAISERNPSIFPWIDDLEKNRKKIPPCFMEDLEELLSEISAKRETFKRPKPVDSDIRPPFSTPDFSDPLA